MKPKTPEAMQRLINEIREVIPFELPEVYLCDAVCKGCSLKLLDYLDVELTGWEARLTDGEIPGLADIQQLAKSSKKIYKVLEKNGLIDM